MAENVPARTLPEFLTYASANPGKIDYAVDATTGGAVMSGRLLNKRGNLGMQTMGDQYGCEKRSKDVKVSRYYSPAM